MKQTWWKIGVVAMLVVAIAVVIAQKQQKQSATPRGPLSSSATAPTEENTQQDNTATPEQPTAANQPSKVVDAPVKSGEVCPTPPPTVSANTPAKGKGQPATGKGATTAAPPKTATPPKTTVSPAVKPAPKALPKLVDVGSTQCIPCKMMAPILEQLKTEYKGQLVVEFVDINENRDAAAQYGVDTIPTQIFYDANGKEFSRHIGFFPKEDILTTFTKQGITLTK